MLPKSKDVANFCTQQTKNRERLQALDLDRVLDQDINLKYHNWPSILKKNLIPLIGLRLVKGGISIIIRTTNPIENGEACIANSKVGW